MNMTCEQEAEQLVRKLFELDAQYQGNIIKASSREAFMREHLYPLVANALQQRYARGYRLAY